MNDWNKVRLGEILTESKVEAEDSGPETRLRVLLNANGVIQRPLTKETAGATKYFRRKTDQFIYGKQNLHKGAFGIIPRELDGFTSSSDLPAFDIASECLPEWIVYFLRQGDFYLSLIEIAKGAATKRIQPKALFEVKIPLPSIQIQKEIIENFKKQEATQGILYSEIKHQKTLISQLKQSILQEAIQGKLTREWRARHPELVSGPHSAAALLENIKTEKARLVKEKKIKREKPLPPIEKEEIPFELPEGWVWCRMQEAGLFERGKSKHRPRNDKSLFEEGTIPFVQTGEVARSKDSNYLINNCSAYYNEKGLAQSRLWPKGTMCITIAANIAQTGFLNIEACFPDSVVGFTALSDDSISRYIRYFIDLTKTEIEKFAPATAQKNINLSIINLLKLPLPPEEEQKAIVAKVESLMEKCVALERQITRSEQYAQMLMQAVLKEAFQEKEKQVVQVMN